MDPHDSIASPSESSSQPADSQFQFISIVNPDESHDPDIRRRARSHAIKLSWRSRRRKHDEATTEDPRDGSAAPPRLANAFPSDTLLASRLQAFLGMFAAVQAAEPVFSVRDPVVFQRFDSVFRTGLEDTALKNAVMLTFALAAGGGKDLNQESLGYQSSAITSLRTKMTSVDVPALEMMPTIGAILLLAGVEARLGEREKVEIHMNGVKHLLDSCSARGIYLTDGIKRAVFWQDLNSSMLTGSTRLFSHTTMMEMRWARDLASYPDWFPLPSGFRQVSHLFSEEFTEIIKDVYALQHIRDSPPFTCEDTIAMLHVDNHQAWVMSRLQPLIFHEPAWAVTKSFHLAVYLACAVLCCKVWRKSPIPARISAELVQAIQSAADGDAWGQCPDLLTWMLCLGGAFASTESLRAEYVTLLRRSSQGMHGWQELVRVLQRFIWAESAYEQDVKSFYETYVA
ncbi:hypothetical protein B0I35DRAFT_446895 [Stachybotrys elegans]|uniref:Transcription factor domain-containing protein n=1 Tax=Stachybotrys elegans TaxID=80388 RepID=A0A8K0WIL7_9HYPO|nr:hypothetical protein B0I35DRAFT_446895 [Stachybotrys elegans]